VPHFGEGRPLLFRWARHRGVVTLRLLRLLLLMMMMIAMMIRGRSGDNRPLIERRQALSSAAALPGNRYATAAVECSTFAPPTGHLPQEIIIAHIRSLYPTLTQT